MVGPFAGRRHRWSLIEINARSGACGYRSRKVLRACRRGGAMNHTDQTKSLIAAAAAIALTPTKASAEEQCPPSWSDRFGCTLTYNPARGSPGPGNGPNWQGEPTDHNSVWRRGYYRGNDPDNAIRLQLMRDR